MAEDFTEKSPEYRAVEEVLAGSIQDQIPFWERAQIRPRELTALQLEKRAIEQRLRVISALLEAEEWHRVVDRLPDDEIEVLAYNQGRDEFFIAYRLGGRWRSERGLEVTHWKDLVPPEGGER